MKIRTQITMTAVVSVFAAIALRGPQVRASAKDPAPSREYVRATSWGELPQGWTKWPGMIDIKIGPYKNFYVLERCYENSCEGRPEPALLKFSPGGKLLKSWGQGLFQFPHGIYVDAEGNVFAADIKTQQVLKFDPEGNVVMTIGKKEVVGDPPDALSYPTAVITNSKGEIFVTEGHEPYEGKGNRVSKFSKDGKFIRSFGGTGSGPGQIHAPHCIAIDPRGRLFVGDRSNNRIEIFTQEGKYIGQWRQFGRPSGMFIAKDGTIYVSDSESNTTNPHSENPGFQKGIRIGNIKDGKVVMFIPDIMPTGEVPSGPEGMTVDDKGSIYGANVRRRMIEVFTPKNR